MRPKYAVVVLTVALVLVPVRSVRAAVRFKILHNFGASGDGTTRNGSPVLDDKGNLYGVTTGGPGQYGYGTVYGLMPQADGTWKEKVLHDLGPSDGSPWGALIRDQSGNLYGTTEDGPGNNGEAVAKRDPDHPKSGVEAYARTLRSSCFARQFQRALSRLDQGRIEQKSRILGTQPIVKNAPNDSAIAKDPS